MTQVDRLKSRDDVLAVEANLPARIEEVKRKISDAYSSQGVALSRDVIDEGVRAFFARRLCFRQPESCVRSRIAYLWTIRAAIGKWTGVGVGVVVAGIVAANVLYFTPKKRDAELQLSDTIATVESAHSMVRWMAEKKSTVITNARSAIQDVASKARFAEIASAAEKAESRLQQGEMEFEDALRQADRALTDVTPSSRISATNIAPARMCAEQAKMALKAADRLLHSFGNVPDVIIGLNEHRSALENVWRRFEGASPAVFATAMSIYAGALAEVSEFGDPAVVRASIARLSEIADINVRLISLPSEINAAANEARANSRDAKANETISRDETAALAAASAGRIEEADGRLRELRSLIDVLRSEFELRIVNRPGEYTRLWRHPKNNSGVKNYYVVVEAIRGNGTPVTLNIRSEEDGNSARVSKWAERVDQDSYELIGADKKDDGVIQNAIFGRKEKGLLEPVYLIGPKSRGGEQEAGRIHRWEYRG